MFYPPIAQVLFLSRLKLTPTRQLRPLGKGLLSDSVVSAYFLVEVVLKGGLSLKEALSGLSSLQILDGYQQLTILVLRIHYLIVVSKI